MAVTQAELTARARRVRLLLLDVDGVLTQGLVVVSATGTETKTFSIRDGAALVWAQRAGLEVALLSGRPSDATAVRAAELGIALVIQGASDKRVSFESLLHSRGLAAGDVAYMGDDLVDLPVLVRAGLAGAPADAAPEVRAHVHWVAQRNGGEGAVREFVELILRAHGAWDPLVESFLN